MFGNALNTPGIVNDSFKDVAFGRRTYKKLDPTYKVSREEIKQIISEGMIAAPTAVSSCPYKFLILDSDEAKKKIDDIMWPIDKDRTTVASFVVIPLADRQWIDYYDKIVEAHEGQNTSMGHTINEEFLEIVSTWYGMLSEDGGRALDVSVSFQTGLVCEAIMLAARAHGLDGGFMDAWNPGDVKEVFGVDTDRYVPQGVMAFGKNIGPLIDNHRLDFEDVVEFF